MNFYISLKETGRQYSVAQKVLLTMKLTTVLLITVILQVSAAGYAQKITLNEKRSSLEKIFKKIRVQCGYDFFFDSQLIKQAHPISIAVKDEELEDVLKKCFANQSLTYTIEDKTVVISEKEESLSIFKLLKYPVKGKVTDEKGQPLPGATVKIKGNSTAAVTDINGDFLLREVSNNDVIVVTFLGFVTAEVPVNNQTEFTIALKEETKGLNEVVVVGYGTQKKVNLSGSVSTISYDQELQNRPITSIGQAIAGNASGITVSQASGQPGRDGTVLRIRGVGTLNNSDPLILIDGVVGSLNTVNPNDIASISVLKDAASAAIYGSRAANGVVLVTTKRGKAGKTVTNYNSYYGIQESTNLFKPVSDYATYMETMNKIQKADNPNNASKFSQSTIDAWRNATDRVLYPNTNWVQEIFGQGSMQKHNISVNGGSEKTRFYLSGAYLGNKGIMQSTKLDEYSLRLNLDHQVSEKVKIGGNLSSNWRGIEEPFDIATLLNYSSNSTPGMTPKMVTNGVTRYGGRNTNEESADISNPLSYIETWFYPQKQQNYFAKLYTEIELIKDLKFQVNGSVNFVNDLSKKYKLSGEIQNLWNFQTNQVTQDNSSVPSQLSQSNESNLGLTFYSTLNYNKQISENHHMDVLVGISRETNKNEWFSAGNQTFPSNDTWELNAGLSQPIVSGNSTDYALSSYFSRINYDFKEKYLFEANLRYDGSSRFAEGKRWGLFPSFSSAWRVSEEEFFKNVSLLSFIDDVKIRGSWGQLGNQNIGLYQYMDLYNAGQNYILGNTITSGIAPTALSNPDITWETTTTTNFGTDILLFKNRLNFTFEWFNRKTNDVLVRLPLSSLYGALTPPYQNVGIVQNRGWEVELGYKNNIKGINYSIGGNITSVDNKVLKFQGDPSVIQSVGNNSIIRQGESINSIYGYQAVGVFKNQAEIDGWAKQKSSGTNKPGDLKYLDINGDNVINGNDRMVIGNVIPKYSYGLTAEASYKGFNLNVLFQGISKVDRYYQNLWYTSAIRARRQINSHFLNAWSPENPDSDIPRLTSDTNGDNVQASSFWVQNSSFLRLKDAQIGYTLPSKILQKAFVSSIQVYANGQNLFTSTKFNGLDPETASSTNALLEYPNVRILTFGINASF